MGALPALDIEVTGRGIARVEMARTDVFSAFNGRRSAQRDLIRVDSRPVSSTVNAKSPR